MKRAVVRAGLASLVVTATAIADPSRIVTAPTGWRADPEQASALAQRFAAARHFGMTELATAAEAYVPDHPGLALFATRATAATGPGKPDEAARDAVDELHASARRGQLTGGAPEERQWQEHVDAEHKQVVASLEWNDSTSHTREYARVVIASDGKRIVAVTGECLATDAADPAVLSACVIALATLDPGIAPAHRTALGLAAAGPPPAATPSSPSRPPARMSDPPLTTPPVREPARLDGRSPRAGVDNEPNVTLPPMTVPQDHAADHRPIYVGGGIIIFAAAFWWNRKRRERFEREDEGASAQPRSRKPSADPDADDLHAAARGEGHDE